MARRPRGTGTVYPRGNIWWISYSDQGTPHWESSGSTDRAEAERLLKQRLGEIAIGRGIAPGKATIRDLGLLVEADHKTRGLRDLQHVQWRLEAHINRLLGSMLATKLAPSHIRKYIDTRRGEDASNATINRELAVIRRGFTLAMEEEPPLVWRIPRIARLEEDNARQGFIGQEGYQRILEELPKRLKALFVCAYHVGTRKGELRKIRWPQVDLDAGLVYLEGRQTKSKKSRVLPIYGDMEMWLRRQRAACPSGCPWVFFGRLNRPVGAHLDGWREACERAGFPDLFFHDLRRSAVRNMRRAGVDQSIRKKISGHETDSMEERYNISDEGDVVEAREKMDEFFASQKRKARAKLRRVK